MSSRHVVALHCDGPLCREVIYAETTFRARAEAREGRNWHVVKNEHHRDFCSRQCLEHFEVTEGGDSDRDQGSATA